MKRWLCGLLFVAFALYAIAQEMSRDDVIKQYSTAISFMTKGNHRYAEGREVLQQILPYADDDIKERIIPKIPTSWYFEGSNLLVNGRYEEAIPCFQEARDGFRDIGNAKSEVDALCQIGLAHEALYNSLGALEVYKEAKDLAMSVQYDTKLMSILKWQRKLGMLIGDTELTLESGNQIDSLIALTDDDKVKYEYNIYKGDEALNLGELELAEQWYLKNEPYINELDKDNMGHERIMFYNKLMTSYKWATRYDEALKYAEKWKEEHHRFYSSDTSEFYYPYIQIADIYRLMGDSVQCFAYLDSFFVARNHTVDDGRTTFALITRARAHTMNNDYDLALRDYKMADSLLANKYDERNEERVTLLPLIGGMENKLKLYEESEKHYVLYAERMKALHGEKSEEYIDALYYLANAAAMAGHIDNGCKHYLASVAKTREQIRERLPYYNANERESYWNSKIESLSRMTPFAIKAEEWQTDFTETCYDGLVLSKSFLLASERSTYDIIKNKGTHDDKYALSMLASINARIKSLEKDYAQNADSILHLTTKASGIEKRLTSHCRTYGDITEFMNIGYQEVKKSLKGNDVLIDFTDFQSQSRGRVYAAYLVDKKQEHPLLQELFEEWMIDSLQISSPDQYYESPYAEAIYKLLWMPFTDKVTEGATVYYVPSQLLFQIALESIPMADGSLLGNHYNFVRLSSAREIVHLKQQVDIRANNDCEDAVLYGGLQYDLAPKTMAEEAAKYEVAPLLATRGSVARGDSIFRELPETKKEVEAIAQTLKGQRWKVKTYSGMNGTEESFLSMSGNAPQILHIATHGFYYTPEEAENYDYLRGYADAMSLSGIVMAGGNTAWCGKELPKGVLGGILTAANIARLDLTGLELVVLSACQTASGKVTSEGLYGLQRAFKKAGVQTMVMTLWSVSDVVTKEFMIKFYENLSAENNHWNKRRAFNDAKTYIRNKYEEPYYWAGFVMLD